MKKVSINQGPKEEKKREKAKAETKHIQGKDERNNK